MLYTLYVLQVVVLSVDDVSFLVPTSTCTRYIDARIYQVPVT